MSKFKVMLAVALAVVAMSMMASAAFAQSLSFSSPLFDTSGHASLSGASLSSSFGSFSATSGFGPPPPPPPPP